MFNAKYAEYNIFSPLNYCTTWINYMAVNVHTTLEMVISECNNTISALIVQTEFPKWKGHN